jgi:hypothetical protein
MTREEHFSMSRRCTRDMYSLYEKMYFGDSLHRLVILDDVISITCRRTIISRIVGYSSNDKDRGNEAHHLSWFFSLLFFLEKGCSSLTRDTRFQFS